jgi:hypothetical protein
LYDEIELVEGGFFGLAELCRRIYKFDFPFFETWDRFNRRMRDFDLRLELGVASLIAEIKTRWGANEFRQCRRGDLPEEFPSLFVQSIGAHFWMYWERGNDKVQTSIKVCTWYDHEADGEVAALVNSVAVPGSDSPPFHIEAEDWL